MHLNEEESRNYEGNFCRSSDGFDRSSSENFAPFEEDLTCHKWTDITEEFNEVSREIKHGKLIHHSGFSLFDAMSAIELMDPKMDAGMVAESGTKLNFEKAVQMGRVQISGIPASALVKLMDATFATLVSWLEGHSLAQTLFINLYMHNPNAVQDQLIRSFCQAILKLASVCYDINRRANVFEDEDFQQMLYNFDFLDDVSYQRTITLIKEAEDECQKNIRHAKAKKSYPEAANNEAVLVRFRFTRYFISSLIALTVQEDQLSSHTPGPLSKKQNFDEAMKNIRYCEECLIKMSEGINAQLMPDSNACFFYSNIESFEVNVNQHLLPPTFPRHTSFLEPGDVFIYLRKLIGRCMKICALPEQILTFDTALDFFRLFSRSENCILTRSVLQIAFLPVTDKVGGKTAFAELVKEAARQFVNPPVLNLAVVSTDNLSECKKLTDDFFTNFSKICVELIRIAGHNRARQRDSYAVVLEDIGNIQEEADRLDSHFHKLLNLTSSQTTPAPPTKNHLARLGSFVLYHVLKCMVEYLTLGFELELYATHEYSYIFWYLNEFLFKWLVNVLHKADSMLYEEHSCLKPEKSKTEKKKTKSKKKWTKSHRFEILRVQAYQKMCEAYYRAMMGFHAMKRIPVPSYANTDKHDGIRYEHRLAPFFQVLTPPIIGYQQYLEISNFKQIVAKISASRLFSDSALCFDESRQSFESVPLSDEQEVCVLSKNAFFNFADFYEFLKNN